MGRRKILTLIFATQFLDALLYSIPMPMLPFLLPLLPPPSPPPGLAYGLVMGAYAGGQALGAPLLGRLSDALSRKSVLLPSLLFTALLLAATAFVPHFPSPFPSLLALRAASGFLSGTSGVCAASLTDVVDDVSRPQYMGILGAMAGLGVILGPAVGSLFTHLLHSILVSFRTACLVSSAVTLALALLIALFFHASDLVQPDPSPHLHAPPRTPSIQSYDQRVLFTPPPNLPLLHHPHPSPSSAPNHPPTPLCSRPILSLCFTSFLVSATFTAFEIISPLVLIHKYHVSPTHVGLLFAAIGLTLVIVLVSAYPTASKILGPKRLTWLTLLLLATPSMVAIPYAGPFGVFIACAGLVVVAQALVIPSLIIMASLLAKGTGNGTVLGFRTAFVSSARAIGPVALGYMYDLSLPWSWTPPATPSLIPFWTGALSSLFATLLLLLPYLLPSSLVTPSPSPQPSSQPSSRFPSSSSSLLSFIPASPIVIHSSPSFLALSRHG